VTGSEPAGLGQPERNKTKTAVVSAIHALYSWFLRFIFSPYFSIHLFWQYEFFAVPDTSPVPKS
jgi:hypothetical protein